MKHWTEDDFLSWLYTGEADARHLDECATCRARAQQMTGTRERATAAPEISWEFLAAQRRSIYRKLGLVNEPAVPVRWAVAAVSLVCILALSVALMRPWTGNTPLYTSADEKLFSDLAAIEQSSEPRAIRPIHHLFKE
jgi:predicted anti-sigma-YlaC factor YlaD